MSIFDPARRAYVHGVIVPLIAFLAILGYVGDTFVPLIPAAVLGVFDLVTALVHRDTTNPAGKVAAAVYALALALQPIGLALAIGTDAQWTQGVALLAAILGGSLAGSRAPMPGTAVMTGTEYGSGQADGR